MFKIAALILISWGCMSSAFDLDKPEVLEKVEACAKESNMDVAKIKEILAAGKKPDTEPDAKTKCFFKCMMVKGGLVNEKGDVNLEKAKEKFKLNDGDEMLKNIEKCSADNKNDDPCERVHLVHTCMMKILKP